MKKSIATGIGTLVLATGVWAQPPLVARLNPSGQLEWNDLSSEFIRVTSYTIESSAELGSPAGSWTTLAVIPGTETRYAVMAPAGPARQFYRLRAQLAGRFPNLRLATFSDIHYFAPDLLIKDGAAFQSYLAADRKMLLQSGAILDQMVDELIQAQPHIVIVPGDLTKDGERVCHQAVTTKLQRLKAAGAKVYVLPGNHDISNPHSLAYDGDATIPVASITSAEFATLYAEFGYGEALSRDPNSLSYVAEPEPGLWILAMDATHPERNTEGAPFTGGYFDAPRLDWIAGRLAEARSRGKFVIGVMHHGLREHYVGQKALFPEYVLDDYEAVSGWLASQGVKLVFSGHYHAQDVVKASFAGSTLYDIETGSVVTYPCPYRLLTLATDGTLSIASHTIANINYDLGGVPFPAYAAEFLQSGLVEIATYMLMMPPYGLPQQSAQFLAPAMAEAFMSHYQGDEGSRPVSPATQGTIEYLLSQPDPMSQMMAYALLAVLSDPPPADNNLVINLLGN
ncbi:MAG: metallophosphoesterase [Verrucomicrobia bacterium]|nr:metallophosphoesterase [Verrucomicrobiota bacterium]